MSEAQLSADVRENLGTGASRALRRTGIVPATVYGAGHKPMSISIQEKDKASDETVVEMSNIVKEKINKIL